MITDDTISENEEQFLLRLFSLTDERFTSPESLVLNPNTSAIIIQDNECKHNHTLYNIYKANNLIESYCYIICF